MDLTDEQWAVIEPLLPEQERLLTRRRGRPWRNPRQVLNGILWVLRTGAPWKDLPKRYPPYQTCHRRFQRWVRTGVMEAILRTLAEDLKLRGSLDLEECFIDGTFVVAKKGAMRGKAAKLMAVADGAGLPIAVCAGECSPARSDAARADAGGVLCPRTAQKADWRSGV